MRLVAFFWAISIAWVAALSAQTIHEAFVSPVTDGIILQAVADAPPAPLRETPPAQPTPEAIWISGYWHYDQMLNRYEWICGIWRLPPPGEVWISGLWQNMEGGWVWLRGFWASQPLDQLKGIATAPPDQTEEIMSDQPNKDSFWVPGYWAYDEGSQQYSWIQGTWATFDPNWMLVPNHYEWRPQGYIFISSYWDNTLDKRGQAYDCQNIPENPAPDYIVNPTVVIQPDTIVQTLFCEYPDYLYLYYHHWYYNPGYWDSFPYTPPWWGWWSWWGIGSFGHWGAWWWWSHPGYPAPFWMNNHFGNVFGPPHEGINHFFHHFATPAFITKNGVIAPRNFINAAHQVNGNINFNHPVVPANTAQRQAIANSVSNSVKKGDTNFKPDGKGNYATLLHTPAERTSLTHQPSMFNRMKGYFNPSSRVQTPHTPTNLTGRTGTGLTPGKGEGLAKPVIGKPTGGATPGINVRQPQGEAIRQHGGKEGQHIQNTTPGTVKTGTNVQGAGSTPHIEHVQNPHSGVQGPHGQSPSGQQQTIQRGNQQMPQIQRVPQTPQGHQFQQTPQFQRTPQSIQGQQFSYPQNVNVYRGQSPQYRTMPQGGGQNFHGGDGYRGDQNFHGGDGYRGGESFRGRGDGFRGGGDGMHGGGGGGMHGGDGRGGGGHSHR